MAPPEFISSGGLHLEGRLQPPVQDETPIDQVTSDNQCICQPSQEQLLEGGVAVSDYQTGGRESSGSHPFTTVPYFRSEQTQSFPQIRNFQDGNSRDNQTLPSTGGVGHILGFQRCLFPHSNQSKVKKVSQVSSKQSNLPVHGSAIWPGDS